MPDIHLKYGGSTAQRTLNCPAWPNVAALAPKIDRTSDAAERGTMLHDIMETWYTQIDPRGTFAGWLEECRGDLDQGDKDALNIAYKATEALLNKYGCDEIICEQMVTWDGHDTIGGSGDMLACSEEVALVIDYKFGYVAVKNTDQFTLYAVAAAETPAVADMFQGKRVVSAIIQPEVSHSAIEHGHDAKELARFRADFLLAVKNSETGTQDGNPGEWCKYCPGAAYCKAKKNQTAQFLQVETADSQELNYAVGMLEDMQEQIKAVEREMLYRLGAGLPVAGYKLVEKQARRHWIDVDAAMGTLKRSRLAKTVYLEPDKLRSPAQIEKAIKAADKNYDVAPMVTKSSTGTTFAKASDKRPAIVVQAEVPEALDAVLNGN